MTQENKNPAPKKTKRRATTTLLTILLIIIGIAATATGTYLLMPNNIQQNIPAPDTLKKLAHPDSDQPRSAVTHHEDGTPAPENATEYKLKNGATVTADQQTITNCDTTTPNSICAPAGWIGTTPVPVTATEIGNGTSEVSIPPSRFSGHLTTSAPLAGPVTAKHDYTRGRSIIVGHVNFGSWLDNTNTPTAMGRITEARPGEHVTVTDQNGTQHQYTVTTNENVAWVDLDQYLRDTYTAEDKPYADITLITCFYNHTDQNGNPIYDRNTVVTLKHT